MYTDEEVKQILAWYISKKAGVVNPTPENILWNRDRVEDGSIVILKKSKINLYLKRNFRK